MNMANFPGPGTDTDRQRSTIFQINRIAAVRLPKKVKIFPAVNTQIQPVGHRLFFENNVILKSGIIENSKPMTLSPPLVKKVPGASPQGKPFIIGRTEAQTTEAPPGKPPRRSLPAKLNRTGEVKRRLSEFY
jgi:hypothetical protein